MAYVPKVSRDMNFESTRTDENTPPEQQFEQTAIASPTAPEQSEYEKLKNSFRTPYYVEATNRIKAQKRNKAELMSRVERAVDRMEQVTVDEPQGVNMRFYFMIFLIASGFVMVDYRNNSRYQQLYGAQLKSANALTTMSLHKSAKAHEECVTETNVKILTNTLQVQKDAIEERRKFEEQQLSEAQEMQKILEEKKSSGILSIFKFW